MKMLLGWMLVCGLVGCGAAPRQVLPFVMQDQGAEASLDLYLYDVPTQSCSALRQTPGQDEFDPDINPAGTRVAYIAQSTGQQPDDVTYALKVYDLETSSETVYAQHDSPMRSPAWSNDGKKIAYVIERDGKLQIDVREVSTDKPAQTIGFGSEPSWRSDDRAIFYNSRDTLDAASGDLMVYDLRSGINQSLSLRGNGFRNLQRGTSLVYTTLPNSRRNEAVWIIDANSRQTRLSSPGKDHRDVQPVHINGTKFVAFTRIDMQTGKASIYVVERYAQDPVVVPLIQVAGSAYTRGGEWLIDR